MIHPPTIFNRKILTDISPSSEAAGPISPLPFGNSHDDEHKKEKDQERATEIPMAELK
jgi:hypothetical protein